MGMGSTTTCKRWGRSWQPCKGVEIPCRIVQVQVGQYHSGFIIALNEFDKLAFGNGGELTDFLEIQSCWVSKQFVFLTGIRCTLQCVFKLLDERVWSTSTSCIVGNPFSCYHNFGGRARWETKLMTSCLSTHCKLSAQTSLVWTQMRLQVDWVNSFFKGKEDDDFYLCPLQYSELSDWSILAVKINFVLHQTEQNFVTDKSVGEFWAILFLVFFIRIRNHLVLHTKQC